MEAISRVAWTRLRESTSSIMIKKHVSYQNIAKFAVMKNKDILIESIFFGLVIATAFILLLNFTGNKEKSFKTGKHSSEIAAKKDFPPTDGPIEEIRASNPSGSIPSAIFIEVGRQILCLFTIVYEVDVEFLYEPEVPLPLTKFFTTLFRTFISPNAP
jgi:hypothetical protein